MKLPFGFNDVVARGQTHVVHSWNEDEGFYEGEQQGSNLVVARKRSARATMSCACCMSALRS